MKSLHIVLGLALALSVTADKVADKIRELDALSNGGALVKLEAGNINRYLLGKHQPYHIFVLYNFVCDPCQELENEYAVLADSYARHAAKNENSTKIYFALAQYADHTQLFSKLHLRGPALVHYAPTYGKAHSSRKFAAGSTFQNEPRADLMASFLKEKTAESIEIYRSPVRAIIALFVMVTATGAFAYYAQDLVLRIIAFVRGEWWIWFLAATGIYFIAVSGFLYDIIRGVPMYGYDPSTGRGLIFSNQNNHQYGMEGFIIGAANLLCGGAIILMTAGVKKATSASTQSTLVLVGVAVFVVVYYGIVSIYKFKSPWYLRT